MLFTALLFRLFRGGGSVVITFTLTIFFFFVGSEPGEVGDAGDVGEAGAVGAAAEKAALAVANPCSS